MVSPVQKLAERVVEQQEREAIAADERKRFIANTPPSPAHWSPALPLKPKG